MYDICKECPSNGLYGCVGGISDRHRHNTLDSSYTLFSGGLLGDVFLHLLPHAFLGEHNEASGPAHVEYDEHKNVLVGLGIFAGLFFFFIMDKMMRVFAGGSGHDHSHSHAHKKDDDVHAHSNDVDIPDPSQLRVRNREQNEEKPTSAEKNVTKKSPADSGIKLSAYLNLFADTTHNFTDGLAMAASFYASPGVGATTAVAVFFHEIPHEVGDYAILIQSGFSKRQAMMAQFTTAIGAFLGTIAGIAIEEFAQSGARLANKVAPGLLGTTLQWGDLVIPFTAGGFMYIATVGVIPELLEVSQNVKKDFRQALSEFAAMIVGLAMMTFIAWNEASA
jgi:zinc transporter 7